MTSSWDSWDDWKEPSFSPDQVVYQPAPWKFSDLYTVMEFAGIPVTDANVTALLYEGRGFVKTFKDRMTEEGYEIIESMFNNIDWPNL